MAISPMMRQYEEAKSESPDALLLFRMGDFYELFHDDAKVASRLLGLALTCRDKGTNQTPMAGFPHHQLESYLGKLIKAGHRVAVCDQVEDARTAIGLVRREVTRIVTPGTLTDDALLDPRECNYLAAVIEQPSSARRRNSSSESGLAWVELSTGQFFACTIESGRLPDELARIAPAECIIPEESECSALEQNGPIAITHRPGWTFAAKTAKKRLAEHFGTKTLEGFGFDDGDQLAIQAAGAVLQYLVETQKTSLEHIERITRYRSGTWLEIDESTRRSLEITRTMRDGQRAGTLLSVLDGTVTAPGSRMLWQWVGNPLIDISQITERQDAIEELLSDGTISAQLREKLRGVYDLQRLLSRISTGRGSPRDLSFVGRTLKLLPPIKAKLSGRTTPLLCRLESDLDLCPDLRSKLEAALEDDCPLSPGEGGYIRAGYNRRLDEFRELTAGGKQWIAQYQAQQIEKSGIPSLKVGFNKVFGYYLEVTHAQRDKVPEHFIRKQTLKNAERYITPELKEYEEKVLSAEQQSTDLEYELFAELRESVQSFLRRLHHNAETLAQIDVLASLAELARSRNYCRPQLVDESVLEIVDGRHPVLDISVPEGDFVPNDTTLDFDEQRFALITGPNMAGKSTYIRQVALITLMAQIGSFVSASKAKIGIVDRIFARVGASDELNRGQSTFMVEMTETARILNNATSRSLVILDEIGRGTSTYDGLALAWAIVEHMHDHIGCRTLFATHYHELTDLAKSLKGVINLNVAVREWQEEVIFLHKITEGSADKSYGIHVARLAGVPREVNQRAKEILSQLEQSHLENNGHQRISRRSSEQRADSLQRTFFDSPEHPLLEKLRQLKINGTTPLEALQLLEQWQSELDDSRQQKPR